MITKQQIEEWRKLKNEGMVSGVGEYTPPEFWEALDEIERLNAQIKNNMSIENVQQMMLDFANSRVAHTSYFSDLDHRNDVLKFIEEWRKENDC